MIKRFLPGLAVASLFVTGQAAQAILVGHWKFDEPSFATTAVDETSGTDGVVGINVTTGLTGIVGNAYQFNGDISVDGVVGFGNATSVFAPIAASQQVTMSAWFNWTVNHGARGVGLSFAVSTTNPNFINLGVTGSALGFNTQGGAYGGINQAVSTVEVVNTTGFNDGGTLVDDALIPEGTGTALDDGLWHHIAMTIDSNSDILELFVDGVSVGFGKTPAGLTVPINPFATYDNYEVGRLGRLTPAGEYFGMVDDIQIYDRILSPDSIGSLFANPGSVAALDGDYNDDGKVDAADYVTWRKNYGSGTSLPNDPSPGVGDDDYDRWRQNFGNAPAGSGVGSGANVPEPSGLAGGFMLLLTGAILAPRRRSIAVRAVKR